MNKKPSLWVTVLAVIYIMACFSAPALASTANLAALIWPDEMPSAWSQFSIDHVSSGDVLYFATLEEQLEALADGRADMAVFCARTGKYLSERYSGLAVQVMPILPASFRMILRGADAALLGEINTALKAFMADGSLDALYESAVAAFNEETLFTALDMVPIEGAETLVVGFAADAPPMGLWTEQGIAAGYHVELMAMLGQAIGKNVEFYPLTVQEQYTALVSGEIDLFFWFAGETMLPDDVVETEVYAQDASCLVYALAWLEED